MSAYILRKFGCGAYGVIEKENGNYLLASQVFAMLDDIADEDDARVMLKKIAEYMEQLNGNNE